LSSFLREGDHEVVEDFIDCINPSILRTSLPYEDFAFAKGDKIYYSI
jgi:hypothetical protein